MKKTTATIALVSLLVACSPEPDSSGVAESKVRPTRSASASPSPTPMGSPNPTPEPVGEKELEVWFTFGDRLFLAQRTVPATPAVGRAAMEQLLARPNEFEANAGVTTAISPDVRLLGLTVENGVATVDLSDAYGSGTGSTGELLSVAQVVYTLTQFPTVHGVSFEVEGEPLEKTAGHGLLLSGPQTRRDWKDQLPSVLVTTPAMGDRVSSPLIVEGTADVVEATVQMRLLDADGARLARAFTTATCGTGCRGDYAHDLAFEVSREQHGVLEVWWDSPEDGSRKDVVRIALTLVP